MPIRYCLTPLFIVITMNVNQSRNIHIRLKITTVICVCVLSGGFYQINGFVDSNSAKQACPFLKLIIKINVCVFSSKFHDVWRIRLSVLALLILWTHSDYVRSGLERLLTVATSF